MAKSDLTGHHAGMHHQPIVPSEGLLSDTPAIWGTWTGTLRWFLASVEGCYTFEQHDSGIVVYEGHRQGVGFANGDSVSFTLPCLDGCPTTGTFTLLNERQAHVVVGGCGVQFEGRLVKLLP